MSYGHLNIWLRDMNCCPKNVWKVELAIKTCTGAYLVDFNPDIIEKLKKALPACEVSKNTWDGETTIHIQQTDIKVPTIKHLEVDLPPGCYIVRAWVCYDNLWTDREMVIVGCGETACVNLIIPAKEKCIANVAAPFAVAAQELRLPVDKVNIAVEMLVKASGVKKEALAKDLAGMARVLKATKAKEALQYAAAFEQVMNQAQKIK